jgi:hypothetical protein
MDQSPKSPSLKKLKSTDSSLLLEFADRSSKKNITITFENCIYSYQFTEEKGFHGKLCFLIDQYGKDFIFNYRFFEVNNSFYLQYTIQNHDLSMEQQLKHYSFIGTEELIDVIANNPPQLNNNVSSEE